MKYNWQEIKQRIPNELKSTLVKCIRTAIEEDFPRQIEIFRLVTTNGAGLQIGNFINTNIQKELTGFEVDVFEFNRYGWRGRIIVDHEMRMVYTVMSNSRLKSLPKTFKETPHYARVLTCIFNAEYNATNKQTSFLEYPYSDAVIQANAIQIIHGSIPTDRDYLYCTIVYESKNLQLTDCKIVFLDRDLDIIEELSLNEYIKPDYAQLTMHGVQNSENEKNTKLVTIKKKYKKADDNDIPDIETQSVEQKVVEPVALREEKKQA